MKKEKLINITKEENKYGPNHLRNQILVNLITAIRSLGTIAIIPIFYSYGALATTLAAAGFFLTDFIDGYLARKLHVESFFGSLLDAVSDKSFGIVCLILLSTLNPIFLVIIGLELGIFAINYNSLQRGNNAKSSLAGKAKTVLLAASIVGSYFCYAAPTLKEILNYVNISSFNKLLELNPQLISTILAIPVIGASLYVAHDYAKTAQVQDDLVVSEEITPTKEKSSLKEIAAEKKALLQKKKELLKEGKELKTRSEIIHDLFDTEFYLKHRDGGIKKLLYKPIKKGSE